MKIKLLQTAKHKIGKWEKVFLRMVSRSSDDMLCFQVQLWM